MTRRCSTLKISAAPFLPIQNYHVELTHTFHILIKSIRIFLLPSIIDFPVASYLQYVFWVSNLSINISINIPILFYLLSLIIMSYVLVPECLFFFFLIKGFCVSPRFLLYMCDGSSLLIIPVRSLLFIWMQLVIIIIAHKLI